VTTRASAQPAISRLTTKEQNKEVTPMQLAVLDHEADIPSARSEQPTPITLADDQLPCRTSDPELFFAESPADVEYAKTLCTTCPARLACLAGALERREPWGVWGGEWFVQGVVVPRKRPRGRPRKSEVAA
jgi:WhiB family transcriptional regulator, redox-sensing transcriptional regulator